MTLQDKIDQEFNRLPAGGASPQLLSVATNAGQLESELVSLDSLACAFRRFVLKSDTLAGASLDRLKKVSEALSQRLSYLLEPISPVETDPEGCTVQMRSTPPQKNDDGTSYYELLVRRGGELSLQRYSKQSGSARQVVPAQVTREVFCRLADDFEAVL